MALTLVGGGGGGGDGGMCRGVLYVGVGGGGEVDREGMGKVWCRVGLVGWDAVEGPGLCIPSLVCMCYGVNTLMLYVLQQAIACFSAVTTSPLLNWMTSHRT